MNETFTGRIRKAARALAPNTFTTRDLSIQAGIKSRLEDRNIRSVINDLRKTGEIVNMSRGVYTYAGKQKGKPEIRERMWRILRARRNVSVDDLMELAGASEDYAKQWLRMLDRRGVIRAKNGRYRMIEDPIDMPEDDAKAEALRRLRGTKKAQALKALDSASASIAYARGIMEGLDDD